jgi:hypothetical protein
MDENRTDRPDGAINVSASGAAAAGAPTTWNSAQSGAAAQSSTSASQPAATREQGRRGSLGPVLLIVLAVIVVAIIWAVYSFFTNRTDLGSLERMSASADLNGATSAVLQFEPALATLNVDGGETSRLLTADLAYYTGTGKPSESTSTSGTEVTYRLAQPGNNALNINLEGNKQEAVWNIHLNPNLPTNLTIKAGAGSSTMNLENMKLTRFTLEAGAGNTNITLPAAAGNTTIDVKAGVGNLELVVPSGVEARINVDSGIGNTSVDSRFAKSGSTYTSAGYDGARNKADISIEAGVGNVVVTSKP